MVLCVSRDKRQMVGQREAQVRNITQDISRPVGLNLDWRTTWLPLLSIQRRKGLRRQTNSLEKEGVEKCKEMDKKSKIRITLLEVRNAQDELAWRQHIRVQIEESSGGGESGVFILIHDVIASIYNDVSILVQSITPPSAFLFQGLEIKLV